MSIIVLICQILIKFGNAMCMHVVLYNKTENKLVHETGTYFPTCIYFGAKFFQISETVEAG